MDLNNVIKSGVYEVNNYQNFKYFEFTKRYINTHYVKNGRIYYHDGWKNITYKKNKDKWEVSRHGVDWTFKGNKKQKIKVGRYEKFRQR